MTSLKMKILVFWMKSFTFKNELTRRIHTKQNIKYILHYENAPWIQKNFCWFSPVLYSPLLSQQLPIRLLRNCWEGFGCWRVRPEWWDPHHTRTDKRSGTVFPSEIRKLIWQGTRAPSLRGVSNNILLFARKNDFFSLKMSERSCFT